MQIDIDITDQDLKDLVITAVEGGFTRNWAKMTNYSPQKGQVTVNDGERGAIKVTPDKMALGLKRCAKAKTNEGGWAFGAWLKDHTGDAIIADVILQFGIFGEVIYA